LDYSQAVVSDEAIATDCTEQNRRFPFVALRFVGHAVANFLFAHTRDWILLLADVGRWSLWFRHYIANNHGIWEWPAGWPAQPSQTLEITVFHTLETTRNTSIAWISLWKVLWEEHCSILKIWSCLLLAVCFRSHGAGHMAAFSTLL